MRAPCPSPAAPPDASLLPSSCSSTHSLHASDPDAACPSPPGSVGSPQSSSPGTRSRSGEALCPPRPPAACPVPPSLSLKGQASSCPPSILPEVPVLLVNGCLEPGGIPLPDLSTAPPAPVQPNPGLSTLNNALSAPTLTCVPDSKCSAIGQLLGGNSSMGDGREECGVHAGAGGPQGIPMACNSLPGEVGGTSNALVPLEVQMHSLMAAESEGRSSVGSHWCGAWSWERRMGFPFALEDIKGTEVCEVPHSGADNGTVVLQGDQQRQLSRHGGLIGILVGKAGELCGSAGGSDPPAAPHRGWGPQLCSPPCRSPPGRAAHLEVRDGHLQVLVQAHHEQGPR